MKRNVFLSLFLTLSFLLVIPSIAFAGKKGGGGHAHGGGNPPGPAGGAGAGPKWTDNPNKVDNPPGPVGGKGTDWTNPPGPKGGEGAGPTWKSPEERAQRLAALKKNRAHMIENGASSDSEKITEMDELIEKMELKSES